MSIELNTCFTKIIGLSEVVCECFDDNKPEDFNESLSGLYLDKLLSLNTVKASENCEYADMWTMMDKARTDAVGEFKADLLSCILGNAALARTPWKGIIGDIKRSGASSMNLTTSYAGIRIHAADIVGGVMKLKRIGTTFSSTGTVSLYLYNNIDEDPLYEFLDLPVISNKLTWYELPTAIELPMHGDYGTNLEYYLIYQVSNQPREMTLTCNTCGGWQPYFDVKNPHFMHTETNKGRNGWGDYVLIAGIKGSDLTDFLPWAIDMNRTFGLLLDAEFNCDAEQSLCDGVLDFKSNPVAVVMAYAIRFKAAIHLIDAILRSGKVNRYTMLESGILLNDKVRYEMEYNNRVMNYLCPEMVKEINLYSDCFKCRDEYGMRLVGNLK